MTRARIAVTLDERLLAKIDRLVSRGVFPSRSQAIEEAVREKVERLSQTRLARECAKLDPAQERSMAEEGIGTESHRWPDY